MTYQEVWTNGLKMLQNAGIEDARECTGVLFERVYGIDAAHFILHRDEQAPAELRHEFRMLIERRSHHEPLQYIMGSCGFMNWDFFVDRSVLIPRQDTETLVEEFLADITRVRPEKILRILDLCTGSGCVGISVKKYLDQLGFPSKMTLADMSVDALTVARKNARDNEAIVDFVISDMFENLEGQRYDAILCNPPYIPTETCTGRMPEVSWFEPRQALDGGADGLDFYRRLAAEAKDHLLPGPGLYMEIGYDQAKSAGVLFRDAGWSRISLRQDLSGNDRVLKVRP